MSADRKTLLEQAREISPTRVLDRCDDFEVADVLLAWVMGEVGTAAAGKVLKVKATSNVYTNAGSMLRRLVRDGCITIEKTDRWDCAIRNGGKEHD